jgi:TolB-like protein/Tfp pilus assembly protein PilF
MSDGSGSKLFNELKRRNVIRTGVAYIVIAWLLVQVADLLLETFAAPSWVMRAIVIALAIGFPIAVILGWIYEITTDGVKRTENTSTNDSITVHMGRKIDFAIIGVLLVAIALFSADRFRWMEIGSQPTDDRRSIAVLPFTNRSAQADDGYFVDGIHDDILSNLAKVHDLLVISRTSVMQYRNTEKSIPEIAAELGVAAILEGGVQRAGGTVRINMQLIDGKTDEHLWAETYDRELDAVNIFSIQSEIAQAVVLELAAALTADEQQRIEQLPTENLEAYNAVLRGDERRSLVTVDGRRQAEVYYRRALELDAEYAVAWQRLAGILLAQWRNGTKPDETMIEARAAADRSLELDVQNGHAWLKRAEIEMEFSMAGAANYSGAEIDEMFGRAIELMPNDGDIYARYAVFASWHTQDWAQVMALLRKAVALDPLSARLYNRLGDGLRKEKHFEEAQQEFARARSLEPDNPFAYWHAGETYRDAGDLADAIIWMEKAFEFEQNDAAGPFYIAMVAADLGEPELVDYWINKGLEIDSDHTLAAYTRPTAILTRGDTDALEELAEREVLSGAPLPPSLTMYNEVLRDRDIDNGEPELALARYREMIPAFFLETVPVQQIHPNEVMNVAYLLQHLGQDERATYLLETLLARLTDSATNAEIFDSRLALRVASTLGLLGRQDEAVDYLEQVGRSDWPNGWVGIRSKRTLDPIRDTPAFQSMEQRLETRLAAQRARYAELTALETGGS